MSSFRICGPKLSVFGICLSIWGIIQLSIMALAFYQNSVAMVEDLPESAFTNANCIKQNHKCTLNETVEIMTKAYGKQAQTCVMAVALYTVTLIISLHQYWTNSERHKVARLNTNPHRGRKASVCQSETVKMHSFSVHSDII